MSRRTAKREARLRPEKPKSSGLLALRVLEFCEKFPVRLAVAFVLLATVRIVATYPVFGHTIDEPAHIACGMEWLDRHTYTLEPQHPPLARVAAAIGPYLLGGRSHGMEGIYQEGNEILYSGDYQWCLTVARLGILPFFWLASAAVYFLARRAGGRAEAALAVLLFTLLPPVLAHAGLATTDMPVTAFLGAAFVAGVLLVERPSLRRGCVFGALLALAVLSKLSALAFVPAVAAVCALWCAWNYSLKPREFWMMAKRLAIPVCIALGVACVLIWAAYRFSFGPVTPGGPRVPAPEFFRGIQSVIGHNRTGHPSYLLGQHSESGFWYYYLVVLPVKTPIPFLLLLALGAMAAWKRRRLDPGWGLPLAFSLAILVVAMFSRITIGVRHILPVYLGFSVVAALGTIELLKNSPKRIWAGWVVATCGLWLAAGSLLAHPDYLPYCNALAGDEPEKILADSDLDWGQDTLRLGKRLQELGAPELTFNPFVLARYDRHGFPPVKFGTPQRPSPGWNAVSITVWKVARFGLPKQYANARFWPDVVKPRERVGKSILLYYFPYPG